MAFHISGIHHIGLTVRDIKRSFEWYTKMFDLFPGPVNRGSGEALSDALQVKDAELEFSMVAIGGTRIEFLQYLNPVGKDFDRTNGDVGSTHICIQVSDMDAAYAELQAKGAVFNAPPITLTDGDLVGSQWAYFRDPDGIQLEIWESPAT